MCNVRADKDGRLSVGEHHMQVMGANNVKLSKEDEEAYKQLTFFTEKEVGLCYRRFVVSSQSPPQHLLQVLQAAASFPAGGGGQH